MDGAGPWQRFKNVTLVFLRPAMIPYAVYGFVVTFNLFYLTYFMTQGGPFGRTELLVTQAYNLVNASRLYGVAAAFGRLRPGPSHPAGRVHERAEGLRLRRQRVSGRDLVDTGFFGSRTRQSAMSL